MNPVLAAALIMAQQSPATPPPAFPPASIAPTPQAPKPAMPSAPQAADRKRDIGFLSAGALADRCKSAASADISGCFAYVAAVYDTMRAYEIWLGQKEFCAPAGISQGELRQAFLTYLSAYQERRAGQAASVIVVALKDTYPCPTSPRPTLPSSTKP